MSNMNTGLYAAAGNVQHVTRRERNGAILDKVRKVCQEQGGMSIIGGGYVIVDTSKFKITETTKGTKNV